ncbi:hypothetical protein DRH14_02495 [Candidatus Shapirobacteria bacterium]|nr:MAG: hypothetical protein DRH14_02495 [Candidatus Shapirobacteria bacterium]
MKMESEGEQDKNVVVVFSDFEVVVENWDKMDEFLVELNKLLKKYSVKNDYFCEYGTELV